MAYGDNEPLLGGSNKWVQALSLLGATLQDVGGAVNGKPTNALLGAMAMQEKMRQQQRQQAEEASQKSAQAALLGGLDPSTGITWNQPRQGTSVDDQKALFMRAFPEAGAKAAAASLFPKPMDPKDRYMAVDGALIDLTKPGAGPVYQAPSQWSFPAGMAPTGGQPAATGGTTTSVQPAVPSAGADPASFAPDLDMKIGMMEEKYGLPSGSLRSLVQAESGGRAGVVSPKGAMGYTQLMPGTAKDLGVDPNNPDQNLEGGARYLKQQYDKYGNLPDALVAYNWGPGNADMWIKGGRKQDQLPAETRAYVAKNLGVNAAPVQVAQANTGTMTDAMPAGPATPAGQGRIVTVPNRQDPTKIAYYDTVTRQPVPPPQPGYRYSADGTRQEPIPGGPKDDSGGGPFAGNAMDAQASNIVIATEQKMANGETVSPQERFTYELAKRHLMQPRVVPGPDGSLQSVAPTPLPAFPTQQPSGQTQQAAAAAPAAPAAAPQAPAPQPGQPAVTTIVQGQQKPTNEQSLAAGYGNRLATANQIFSDLEAKGYVVPGLIDRAAGSTPLGNWAASSEYQQLDQAQREFINAQLRRESGAAIAPSEFESARKQYFPQPGDSPAVLAQKKKSRELALENMRLAAGPLGGKIAQPAQQGGARVLRFDAQGNMI